MASRQSADPYVVPSGEAGSFVYTGEDIPNQVLVANLDQSASALFWLTNTEPNQWRLHGLIAAGESVSIWLQCPLMTFTNVGTASIRISGFGIFPSE